MSPTKVVRLPLSARKVLSSRTDGTTTAVIHCPRCDHSINAVACLQCDGMLAYRWDRDEGGHVICAHGRHDEQTRASTTFAEAAAACQLHEIIEPVSICASPEFSLTELARVFVERELRAAPVVDDEDRLVGVITRSDLIRTPSRGVRVADVMPSPVHALPECAPVGYAIALMAMENISVVPIVTDSGRLVGLVHALDVLRWVAERMGYITPATSADIGSAASTGPGADTSP